MGFEQVVYLVFKENIRTNEEKRWVLSKLWIWFVIESKESRRKILGFEQVVYLDFNENKRWVLSKLWIWFTID